MTLQTRSPAYGTPDITAGTQQFDYSPVLLASLNLEPSFLAALNVDMNDPVKDPVGYWEEDDLVGNQVTLGGTLATGGVTITLSAADNLKIGYNANSTYQRVGAILQVMSSSGTTTVNGNGEQLQVTAFPGSTSATVTRAYGQTADPGTTYDATTTILKLVQWPMPEYSSIGPDQSRARRVRYNFSELFGRDIIMSRNQILRKMQTIGDEVAYQIDQRTIEIVREMNDAFLHGSPSGVLTGSFPISSGAGDNRTLAGIEYWLRVAGSPTAGGTYDTTAEDLTPTVLNNMVYAVAQTGARPTAILTGFLQERVIQGFGADKIFITPNERIKSTTPNFSTFYRTDLGPVLSTVVDQNYGNGAKESIAVLDMSRIKARPFLDSALFLQTAPTLQDGDAARLIGEWTLEVRNAYPTLQAHALHTGLTLPS
jgi:hypothetical protein